MENRRNKKKKGIIERMLDYSKISDDNHLDDYLMDTPLDNSERYERKKSFYDLPTKYEDEDLIDKLIMGELLNFNEIEELMERSIKEFKRTFSAPNKNIEIVFREFKGKDFGEVIKEIYDDKSEDPKDKEEKSKDGDTDER